MVGKPSNNEDRRRLGPPDRVGAIASGAVLVVALGLGLWTDVRRAQLEGELRALQQLVERVQRLQARVEMAGREWLQGDARAGTTGDGSAESAELTELAELLAQAETESKLDPAVRDRVRAALELIREWTASRARLQATLETEGPAARARYAEFHGAALERWRRLLPELLSLDRVHTTAGEAGLHRLRWTGWAALGLAALAAAGLWWSAQRAPGRIGREILGWAEAVQQGRWRARWPLGGNRLWVQVGERLTRVVARMTDICQTVGDTGARLRELHEECGFRLREAAAQAAEARVQHAQARRALEALAAEMKRWAEELQAGGSERETSGPGPGGVMGGGTAERGSRRGSKDAWPLVREQLGRLARAIESMQRSVLVIAKAADQSQLLAVNAAIEAEKAGEYGLGFAVVAGEVRRLADQTAVAVGEIEQTLQQLREDAAAGVRSCENRVQGDVSGTPAQDPAPGLGEGAASGAGAPTGLRQRGLEAILLAERLRGLVELCERSAEACQETEAAVGEAMRVMGRLDDVVTVLQRCSSGAREEEGSTTC